MNNYITTERSLINYFGLLGIISFISYAAAVFISPMAYPGYNWLAQAVSDLSARSAPSRELWQQLSALYNICSIVSVTLVCVYVVGRLNKLLRLGIYLFTIMNWISSIGYTMFPLTEAGSPNGIQNIMHLFVTVMVVIFSIISLIMIIVGGFKEKKYKSLAFWACVILAFMMAGAIGTNVVPSNFFGIPERFSCFAAVVFNAVLGVYLFKGFKFNKA